jgi:ubiquitin-conjugating enzyme E2 G1
MATKSNYAQELLMRQLTELKKNPNDSFSVGLGDDGNLFRWEIMIMGPADSLFEGGFFKAEMTFPPDFPNSPPTLKFLSKMWHPNIYPDGKVCISILHAPGEDKFNTQESAEERWRPILGVESVLVSVLSMLCDPNIESPANIDAAKQLRDEPKEFKRAVRRVVRQSADDM